MRQRVLLSLILFFVCKPSPEKAQKQKLVSRYSGIISALQLKPKKSNDVSKALLFQNSVKGIELRIDSDLNESMKAFFKVRKEFMKDENTYAIKNEITSNYWFNYSMKKGLLLFDSAIVKMQSLSNVKELQMMINKHHASKRFNALAKGFRILPGNSRIKLTEQFQAEYQVGGHSLKNCLVANYSWDNNGRLYACSYENKKQAARKLYDLQKASLKKNPNEKAELHRREYGSGEGIAYFYTREPNKSCNGYYNYKRFIFGIEGVNSLSMCKALVNEMIGNL